MPACRATPIAVLIAVLALAAPPAASPDDAAAKQQQLEKLKSKIDKVQADQNAALQKRDAVQVELRQSERSIAGIAKELADADRRVAAAQNHLADLQRQQTAAQAALDTQKAALAQQMQAAYREGRDSQLQLLLDAQDPGTVGRLLAYYDYVNQARVARITVVRRDLDALNAVNAEVKQQLSALQDLRDSRARMLAEFQQQGAERRSVLGRLNAGIRSRDTEMAKLKKEQQTMQSLLANLQQALVDVPPDLLKGGRFKTLKGRLLWPAAGKMLNYYGQARAGGHLRWDGDLIAAPAGAPVRAVSQGRVVYADWMPHFGLLL
ncbi:MAG: murein hydrolase activator EnvC family protein, partial [Bacillota bacterium]